MKEKPIRIEPGSRIGVIGGGPAGSFFSLYAMHYAEERGIHPHITIYQQRDFNKSGPRGCKGCAGILSASLLRNMDELGLDIPHQVVQDRIEEYTLHSPYTTITISRPERGVEVASVYRGGGPSISRYDNPSSFDGWLLRHVQNRGVEVRQHKVTAVHLENKAYIETRDEESEYDLVVLASGTNIKSIPIQGQGYIPPETRIMFQGELYAGSEQIESHLGSIAHIFMIPHSDTVFGTLVPKGQSIHVSVLSSSKHPVSISEFLDYDIVRETLPDYYEQTCTCRPRAVIGCAQNYYSDRFVAVGDAVVSRLYKDGIGSALLTARKAAYTAIHEGISQEDFNQHYRPFCSSIDQDNKWGKLLFSVYARAKDSRAFLLAQHRLISNEQNNTKGSQPITKIVWGMFTGSYRYQNMAGMIIAPLTLSRSIQTFVTEALGATFRRGSSHYPKKLDVGKKKVLILGGGFVGMYTLRHLVRSLNRNENIETTMVSDENYFLFTPLLHEVASGRIETRHIAYPIRKLHRQDRFTFIQANVENVDLYSRKVHTNIKDLDYDYLVLALGSCTDMSNLYSLESNVFKLKTLSDSIHIRNHIVATFEMASIQSDPERQRQLLTFIVSGGGYTGVQLITELTEFIFKHLTKCYQMLDTQNIRIILIEAEERITEGLHPRLAAHTVKQLRRMGVELRLNSRVTRVWQDRVEVNGTEILPTATLIWVAGVVANPQIAKLDLEKDSIGRIKVNAYLEVSDSPGVYAAGDCAHFKDPKSDNPIPPRAHIAVRQAKVVAHNILAEIRGMDKKPYRYSDTTEVVSLGTSRAVLRFYGLRLYGVPARLSWLAGYSLLVTGRYNRIRVMMDWLLSFIFGRDTSYIKLDQLTTNTAPPESLPSNIPKGSQEKRCKITVSR